MILSRFPPMGVYETLFKFRDSTGLYMGDEHTHPWAQGFPLTTQIPGGPEMPRTIAIGPVDRKYPQASGQPQLVEAIVAYYRHFYGAKISEENVAIFAGGRPAIFATLAFLQHEMTVVLERTEYTPYYDMLKVLQRPHAIVRSDEENHFRPGPNDYDAAMQDKNGSYFLVKSNPCNPTGVTLSGEAIKGLLDRFDGENRGALIDEAYEFFLEPEPDSVLRYIDDINETNIIVIGAATKGLQVPGMRVGWAIASREHIEIFRNYSSFGMGGVSRASQLYVSDLFDLERIRHARNAVSSFYTWQRKRYLKGLESLGLEILTGNGGFYHWLRLPDGLSGDEFNERLFKHNAGILPGRLCDMGRTEGHKSKLDGFIRFSFGPLTSDSFDSDMAILAQCLQG